MRKAIAGVIAGCALAFAGHALVQEKLTVWWVKGFYKSEVDALYEAIKK
jgi:multiple sugar transport system substrate-binding protein